MIEQFKSECWDITFTFIMVKNYFKIRKNAIKMQKQAK